MSRFSPSLLGSSNSLVVSPTLLTTTTIDNSILFSNEGLNLNEQNISNGSPLKVQTNCVATNTNWLDVHAYSNVVITMEQEAGKYYWLIWSGSDNIVDINSAIMIDEYVCKTSGTKSITRSYYIRAKWLCILTSRFNDNNEQIQDVNVDFASLSFVFKHRPTDVQIGDDMVTASVKLNDNYNSLYTILTDQSGTPLATTYENEFNSSLYTSLSDASGKKLLIQNNILSVALKDSCGNNIDSTKTTNNSLFVSPTNIDGVNQASINLSNDLSLNGVALFYSLQDNCGFNIGSTISSNEDQNENAVFVTFYNPNNIETDSIHVKTRKEDLSIKYSFDLVLTNTATQIVSSNLISEDAQLIFLKSLNIYNNNNIDVYVEIYDVYDSVIASMSSDDAENLKLLQSYLKFTFPVLKDNSRDFNFDVGVAFKYGIYAIARNTVTYGGGSENTISNANVYLNGTYTSGGNNSFRNLPVDSPMLHSGRSGAAGARISSFNINDIAGWINYTPNIGDSSINYVLTQNRSTLSDDDLHYIDIKTYNQYTYESALEASCNFPYYPKIPNVHFETSIANYGYDLVHYTDISISDTDPEGSNNIFRVWGCTGSLNSRDSKGGIFRMDPSNGFIISEEVVDSDQPERPIYENIQTSQRVITCAEITSVPDVSSFITQIDYHVFTNNTIDINSYSHHLKAEDKISNYPGIYSIIPPEKSNNNDRLVLIRSNDSSISNIDDVTLSDFNIDDLTTEANNGIISSQLYKSDYFGPLPENFDNDKYSVQYFSLPLFRGYLYADVSSVTCSFTYFKNEVEMSVYNDNDQSHQCPPGVYTYTRANDISIAPLYLRLESSGNTYTNKDKTTSSNIGTSRLIYLYREGV